MSFVKKIASGSVLALAMFTFTTYTAAQDDSTNNNPDRVQKERRGGRGDGYGKRGGKGRHGGMHGGFGMRGLKQLNLSDAQREQIKGIMESAKTANEPLRSEMKSLMEKRRGGEQLSDSDRDRLKELRNQMKQSHEQIENQIMGILTADQRQQLEQIKADQQKRREEFRQRRQERKMDAPGKDDGK